MVEVPVIMEATFSKAKRITAIDFERTLSPDRRYSVGLKKNTHALNSPAARKMGHPDGQFDRDAASR